MQPSYQKCFYHMKPYWFPSLVKCMQLDTTISLSSFTASSCIRQGQRPKVFFCFTKCNELPEVKDPFKEKKKLFLWITSCGKFPLSHPHKCVRHLTEGGRGMYFFTFQGQTAKIKNHSKPVLIFRN